MTMTTTYNPLATPDALALLSAIDGDLYCKHCGQDVSTSVNSANDAGTCYACHRDTPTTPLPLLLAMLADLLEEHGDSRASGLRLIGDRRPSNPTLGFVLWTEWVFPSTPDHPHLIRPETFRRMRGKYYTSYQKSYDARAAAFLALAEALADA